MVGRLISTFACSGMRFGKDRGAECSKLGLREFSSEQLASVISCTAFTLD